MSSILQEDNYFILQEDGNKVLTEDLMDYSFSVSEGLFSLSSIDAGLRRAFRLDALTQAVFSLTGSDAGLFRGLKMSALLPATFSIVGQSASIIKLSILSAVNATISLSGKFADIYESVGIWRKIQKITSEYQTLEKPLAPSYTSIGKGEASYSSIAPITTDWEGSGDVGDSILQEDGFLILQEDGYRIKIPQNIWTNIPKN